MARTRHSKLSFDDAETIRAHRAAGESTRDLAVQYQVSPAAITAILNFNSHRPVGMAAPPRKANGRPPNPPAARHECGCGCGELATPGSRFKPGHNSRVASASTPPPITPRRTAAEFLASTYGNVRMEDTGFATLCMSWQGGSVDAVTGYALARFDGRTSTRHRLVFTLLTGEVDRTVDIHHRCRNRLCVKLDHLEAKSHSAHAQHHTSRLTQDDVDRIRELAAAGVKYPVIAAEYSMHKDSIANIVGKKRWRPDN
jgi:hypothetical protein